MNPQITFILSALLETAILIVAGRALFSLLEEFFIHLQKSHVQEKIFINLAENPWQILLIISDLAIFLKIWAINITPIVASAGM